MIRNEKLENPLQQELVLKFLLCSRNLSAAGGVDDS
jgi:hypothetical protein